MAAEPDRFLGDGYLIGEYRRLGEDALLVDMGVGKQFTQAGKELFIIFSDRLGRTLLDESDIVEDDIEP